MQYPNPAGLKRVRVDRYSRTVYNRVPEPPPRGPKGADRITILESSPTETGGVKAKDFLTGLNLASGLAFGHGGVFVLQAPYLLFYPDRDRDDVPDGDPEVLLSGFGMEDAHSVANSLTWGPDGWLYGCQGSTVTANVRGIEFQQGVWRYHPLTRRFELFCEGGGNSWIDPGCLTWDDGIVVQLAQAAYNDRSLPEGTLDVARLTVLADALEDAGYREADLLDHLRRPGSHWRGCWALDALLGLS